MSIIVKLPHFNEAAQTYTIGKLFAHHGQWVNAEDVLCEVESDKVVYEICAEQSGYVHFLVKEGDTVRAEEVICTLTPGSQNTADNLSLAPSPHVALSPEQEEYRQAMAAHETVKTIEVSGHIDMYGRLVLDKPLAVHNIPSAKIIIIYTAFE